MSNNRLSHARKTIEDVLCGEITEQSHPWVFDDDLLHFNVQLLERQDWAWLQDRLADGSVPRGRRLTIASQLSPAGQGVVRPLFD